MEGDETTSHTMVFSPDLPPAAEDISSAEDSFEGEGTVEAPPLDTRPAVSPISDALHRIVDLCGGRDNGVVSLDRLMEVIENHGFSTSNQDESTLTWVHSALCRESEAEGLVEDSGSGHREILVNVLRSRIIRELLNHFHKESHLNESEVGLPLLLDPSECAVSPVGHVGGGDATNSSARGRTSSPHAAKSGSSPSESLSALGASLFSFGSHEGIAGDLSFQDSKEVEELHHMVLKLNREKGRLLKQITQADDTNQAMAAENARLLERVRSLCAEKERWKASWSELEEVRAALAASEASCQRAERTTQRTSAAKAVVEEELKQHIVEVSQLKIELSLSEQRESRSQQEALMNKECLLKLEQENSNLRELLSEESSKLEDAARTVVEISDTIESLKQEKSDLELELSKLQGENSRLKDTVLTLEASLATSMTSVTLAGSASVAPSDPLLGTVCGCNGEGALESDEGVYDDRCLSPAGLSSLPICQEAMLGRQLYRDTASSTPLMRRSAALRTPFRGIPRAQSWDIAKLLLIFQEDMSNNTLLSSTTHSSLPSRIVAVTPTNVPNNKGEILHYEHGVHHRLQELEAEVELSNSRIRDLESKLHEKEELQEGLERNLKFLSRMLCSVLVGLCEAIQVLKKLNDAAVRILESHAGPSSISAQVQQDNRLVSTLEDVSPDSVYSFPEDVVREQIELELQTLRAQITKSQAVLTYLHTRSSRLPLRPTLPSSAADRRAAFDRCGFSEDGPHPDDRMYDTVDAARSRSSAARGNLSSEHRPSARDSHPRLPSTLSCPVLPARDATVARATQTEQTSVSSRKSQTDQPEPKTAAPLIPNGPVPLVSSRVPSAVSSRVPPAMSSSATSPVPRRRTHSFVCAIRGGSPQLVDASAEDEAAGAADRTAQVLPQSSEPVRKRAKPQMYRLCKTDIDKELRERRKRRARNQNRRGLQFRSRRPSRDTNPSRGTLLKRHYVPLKKTTFMLERPETESAQGSLEGQEAFPSFSDVVLVAQGLSKDSPDSDQMSEEEIETKFTTLSLGFKTDRLTLTKRLELHQRHRDIAEGNIHSELDAIRDLASTLNSLWPEDEKIREVVAKIQNHVAVIQQSTDRVSSQAEVYGAVQQEERMSRAFEVMVTHVENLKRASEKEHRELEEARKLLLDHQLQEVAAGSPPTKDSRGRLLSVPNPSLVAGPIRAFRSLGANARRCSLPMAQALPSSEEAHGLLRDAIKAECHPEEDIPACGSTKAEVPHGIRDAEPDAESAGACQDLNSQVIEEVGAVAEGMPLETSIGASDALSLDDCLSDDVELDNDESEPGRGQEQSEERRSRSNLALLQWAAVLVTRLKFWLNNSRRVLAGKRRLPPIASERVNTVRYVVSGFLLAAALISVLVALLPGASSEPRPLRTLESIWDVLSVRGPYLSLHRGDGPPPT
ncbi:unnamed protein product [Ixodes hexagonus]